MGILIVAVPLSSDFIGWLADEGIDAPADRSSRWPTLAELQTVLDALERHTVEYNERPDGEWRVEVTPRPAYPAAGHATVRVRPAETGDGVDYYFSKPAPELAVFITRGVAAMCGPYVMMADCSGTPALVDATTDVDRAVAQLFGDD